jgi:4-amino-4-deoxy-L-arabinose transferase-like glycosyltransferase
MLILLWIPGLKYPVVSDTSIYAFLGRSVWEQGAYDLLGTAYAKHLPLHAVVSYPLVILFGMNAGMKLSTLLAGFAVLIAIFALTRRLTSPLAAVITTVIVLIHPGFVLMTTLGSADLLFAALFLFFLLFYVTATDDKRWYILAGLSLGLACLTRYNGVPVFLFFLGYTAWKRRSDLQSSWFWGGVTLAGALFSLWLIRNWILFGNPLYSEYTGELQAEAPNRMTELVKNIVYYGNPIHNIFPFLFPFALYGIWKYGKTHALLIFAFLCVEVMAMVWWVKALRFAFPGYPILLVFASLGLLDLWNRWRNLTVAWVSVFVIGIGIQGVSLCLYSYGACNAVFDRTVGLLPKNMGLTPEGFYAWGKARDYINANAPKGSTVEAPGIYDLTAYADTKIFRSDIHIKLRTKAECPLYAITQRPTEGDEVVFETEEYPRTYVTLSRCIR